MRCLLLMCAVLVIGCGPEPEQCTEVREHCVRSYAHPGRGRAKKVYEQCVVEIGEGTCAP
jgi:hypothetical protein